MIRKEVSKGTFQEVNIREVVGKIREHGINVGANYIMDNGLYLPSGNNITNEEIDYVCDVIKKAS